MKTSLSLVCIAVSVLSTLIGPSQVAGQSIGDGYFEHGAPVQGMTDVHLAWPGRLWFQVNLADSGLGYQGTYFTLGAKQHLFQDFLDGRWLLEARGHLGTENGGGFFANIGLERVFSLESAGAEITAGFWYDYDGDQSDFGEAYNQLSVNASIETRNWLLYGNGYFPVGDTGTMLGDPLNGSCFLQNSIVTSPGIDAALQGFDAMLLAKPAGLQHVNGTIGFGGYGYGSDLVDFFGGVRGRVGMQFDGGLIVQGEINHDNRFDITGVVQIGWLFGAGAKGTEYGFLGTDLEPTLRNDHIVRYRQEVQLAIDPDTGRAYDVYHVDNNAAAGGDGTFERPFDNLAAAEAASADDDIIFVREGGGTTRNMDQGITLKPGQLLLGDGVRHLIPLADGTNFLLCNDLDGLRPTITNVGVGNAVNLSSRNTVRGFVIDGSAGGLQNGISGNSGFTLTDGIIEDVTIVGNPILDGVFLNNIAGDWTFARNDIQTARDGISIQNAIDPASTFLFTDNVVSFNLGDGIRMDNFDAQLISFIDNDTSFNGGNGINLMNYLNASGAGVELDFIDTEIAILGPTTPTASDNTGVGIALNNVEGNIRFLNMEIRNNLGGGISLIDVTTPGIDQEVFIGTSGLGESIFDNNGVGTTAGIFNDLGVAAGTQQLFITDSTFINGGSGIVSQATAVGANLTTDIFNNLQIANNDTDGIQLNAFGGATHLASVINTDVPLDISNNGGNGISINSRDPGPISLVEAVVQGVSITNSGFSGIRANVQENGQAIVSAFDSTIAGAVDGIQIDVDNDLSSAVSVFNFDNLSINTVGDDGIDLSVGDDTFVDFSLTNSLVDNLIGGAAAGDHGIQITANGSAAVDVDTRLRVNINGNTISNFDAGDGIGILALGDAHVLANISSNDILSNGINTVATGAPTVPFGNGIDLTAAEDAEIYTRITNNRINNNADEGLEMNTLGSGQIFALVEGNNIAGNDIGEDANTVPPDAGIADMTVNNAVGGNVCIAMTNNFFTLPVIFTNLSGPANFRFERNGQTVNPIFLPNAAAFEIGLFGTECEPAIEAEEAVFDGIFP